MSSGRAPGGGGRLRASGDRSRPVRRLAAGGLCRGRSWMRGRSAAIARCVAFWLAGGVIVAVWVVAGGRRCRIVLAVVMPGGVSGRLSGGPAQGRSRRGSPGGRRVEPDCHRRRASARRRCAASPAGAASRRGDGDSRPGAAEFRQRGGVCPEPGGSVSAGRAGVAVVSAWSDARLRNSATRSSHHGTGPSGSPCQMTRIPAQVHDRGITWDRGALPSVGGCEGIEQEHTGARDIGRVPGDQSPAVHQCGGRHQAIDHRNWVWDVKSAPGFSYLGSDQRDDPVEIDADKLIEPPFADRRPSRVPPAPVVRCPG